jgi:aryl carrier-like protein
MAVTNHIIPSHPLFHLVIAHAFDKSERPALDLLMGKTIGTEELQMVLNTAMENGWAPAAEKITNLAIASQMELDLGTPLIRAAVGGHIEAMREMRRLCANKFDLVELMESGLDSFEAIALKHEWFANAYDWALRSAAGAGQIEAMRELRSWGANNFESALRSAANSNQIAAMFVLREWGAKKFSRALGVARKEAVKLLRSWRNE